MSTTIETDDGTTAEIRTVEDNYLIVCDGSANVDTVQLYTKKDGTVTHVITVKGCKQ